MSVGVQFDSSISQSEETRFVSKNIKLFKNMAKKYNCTLDMTIRLGVIYYKFQVESKDKGKGMRKNQLLDFMYNSLNMTDDAINYCLLSVMDRPRNSTPIFFLDSWLKLMIIFLTGSLQAKIDLCFKVYDRLNQGIIARSSMFHFLDNCIIAETKEESEDALKDFVDLIFKKLDVDTDGIISKEDYTNHCVQDPLGIEFLGQCWPSRDALRTFSSSFNIKVDDI
ncbi:hypothetical protein FQR65_LT10421 [Abscondita terminalis]|nr:hypothetical protein FQR65_LT10421 [Abscondita terminalis]